MKAKPDVIGRTLKIGDTVITTFNNSSFLEKAKVISFTPHKIGVTREFNDFYYTKFPRQVCLVESI